MARDPVVKASCGARIAADTADDVLAAIAERVATALRLKEHKVLAALRKREAVASTGLEHGVAIPHCALPKAGSFAVGIVTLPRPVDFGALDGNPSDIFVFVAGPEDQRTEHVRILAAMTARLRESEVRDRIRAATADEDLQALLSEGFLPEEHEEAAQFTMLVVYVQDEALYEPVLEAVSAETDASVAVSDAQSAGSILHRMPLFATFWTDSETQPIHRIEAIVPQDRANRTIRRVEDISRGRRGVQISAFDLSYGSGSLDL